MRCSLDKVTQFLREHHHRAKKSFSQNFLIDANILNKILQTSCVSSEDWVLEIGPGFGALTEGLTSVGARVFAVEKDPLFADTLKQLPITLEIADICKFSFDRFAHAWEGKGRVIANLPYNITTPILIKLFSEVPERWKTVTIMVQDEVARRMTASPGGKDFGSLTIFLNFFAEIEYAFKVSPNCFYPKPSVVSAIVHMRVKDELPLLKSQRQAFFTLTRTAFNQRRKVLTNSLKILYPKEAILHAMRAVNLPEMVRPEVLSLNDYLSLFHELCAFEASTNS